MYSDKGLSKQNKSSSKQNLQVSTQQQTLQSRRVLYNWATRSTQLVLVLQHNTIQHNTRQTSNHCGTVYSLAQYTLTQYVGAQTTKDAQLQPEYNACQQRPWASYACVYVALNVHASEIPVLSPCFT